MSDTFSSSLDSTGVGPWGFKLVLRLLIVLVFFTLFGFVFAYDTWAGLGNFLGIQNQRLQLGLELTPLGWFVIIAAVAIPALAYAGILFGFVVHVVLVLIDVLVLRKERQVRIWVWPALLVLALLLVAVINLDLVLGVSQTAIFSTGVAG